jgi:predicted nucleotidyltransferase
LAPLTTRLCQHNVSSVSILLPEADMYLAEAQLAKIRAWAKASPYVDAVRLFGSYAKGNAHERIDIDLAVSANAGHYVTRYTGFLSVHVAEALFLCLTSTKRLRWVPLASDQPTDWTPFVWRHVFYSPAEPTSDTACRWSIPHRLCWGDRSYQRLNHHF